MSLRDQIALMTATQILVGQHGAGLVNMVFLPPDISAVVEIQPPMPANVHELFSQLARKMGHPYGRVWQKEKHSTVTPSRIAGIIRQQIGTINEQQQYLLTGTPPPESITGNEGVSAALGPASSRAGSADEEGGPAVSEYPDSGNTDKLW